MNQGYPTINLDRVGANPFSFNPWNSKNLWKDLPVERVVSSLLSTVHVCNAKWMQTAQAHSNLGVCTHTSMGEIPEYATNPLNHLWRLFLDGLETLQVISV